MTQTITVRSAPGIKRDGTKFEGDHYVDGEWVRFQRGLPRKIGGYRSINKFLVGMPRAISEYTQDKFTYLHFGSANRVERLFIDGSFNTSVVSNRTPTSGFTADDANLWQFAVAYDTTNGNQIVAQVAPNLDCICNSLGGEVFTGNLLGTAPLTPVPPANKPANFNATGGVLSLPPYTMVFGSDGYVAWSVPNAPNDFVGTGSGNAYVAAQKLVRGMPLRGGPGNSPSALLWSADALVRASYVGGTTTFQFDTISTQTSILSSSSVIEYDGVFYWIGSDRFLMFNGVVREVENNLNLNFFFDNLNMAQRQKVFAIKVPRYGEIWWCFPKGNSLEPNHAVIYNVRENTWYDTPLPNGGRGAGVFPTVFQKPIMTGVVPQPSIATSASIVSGGSGYTLGDTLTVVGGDSLIPAELTVATVGGGGVITGVQISDTGRYTVAPTNPVTVSGGSGTSATFNVTFVAPYQTWVHETGVDEVDGQNVKPIRSFFETGDISLPTTGLNRATQVLMLEPDFVQSGDMSVSVRGRANARAPEIDGDPVVFSDSATSPDQQLVRFKEQRRELRFRFESNVVGGDYQMGQVLAHVQLGDGMTLG
jgi:hypothetical protein